MSVAWAFLNSMGRRSSESSVGGKERICGLECGGELGLSLVLLFLVTIAAGLLRPVEAGRQLPLSQEEGVAKEVRLTAGPHPAAAHKAHFSSVRGPSGRRRQP